MKWILIICLIFIGCFEDNQKTADIAMMTAEQTEEETPIMVKVLAVEELPFFWVINGNTVSGYKDGLVTPVSIYADKTDDGITERITITPKLFFIANNSIYFSADFTEIIGEETITTEKKFEQNKGKQPVEIDMFPSVPEAVFYIGDDGRYRIEKSAYNGLPVSDCYHIATGLFVRNMKVSGYHYGQAQNIQNKFGAFLDVNDGLPTVREPGLYFMPDGWTSLTKLAESGRMWKF